MADNRISPSKREIYTKLLDIAEKYLDEDVYKSSDFLKTGLFGWINESMAMMMRDSTYHKSMIYNESFLNTAIIPKSVYNWAKMFNIEIQKATPAYADIDIIITTDNIEEFLIRQIDKNKSDIERYGDEFKDIVRTKNYFVFDKENPILAGDYYFSLEHSIVLLMENDNLHAYYLLNGTNGDGEYISTNYQGIDNGISGKHQLQIFNSGKTITIKARAYQYKRSVFTRQIVSENFLNRIQKFNFDDQFCGAKLFYTENGNKREIPISYSDLDAYVGDEGEKAFYNLSDEGELELVFKSGEGMFLPASNSNLTLFIYTTKGKGIPNKYSGDALILFNDAAERTLPVIVQFNPTEIIGGQNVPSLSKIKDTIINEISTRKTITTQSDLNKYFNILTALISEINDGKVTFIKQRDDILRRMYNAYLLIRDNIVDDGSETSIKGNFISSCVPTNTLDVTINGTDLLDNDDGADIAFNTYLTCDENGNYIEITEKSKGDYYLSPFKIILMTKPVKKIKYIYDLVNQDSALLYRGIDSSDNLETNYSLSPISMHIERDFGEKGLRSSENYTLKLTFNTSEDLTGKTFDITVNTLSNNNNNGIDINGITAKSEIQNESSETFLTTIEFTINAGDFTANNLYEKLVLTGSSPNGVLLVNDKEKLIFKIGNTLFITNDEIQLFNQLDNVMDSSIDIEFDKNNENENENEDSTSSTIKSITINEVPLIHSSFFDKVPNLEAKRKGLIKQLLSYINLLEEKLSLLETATFFNIKFYNTYGRSHRYSSYVPETNLKIALNIRLKDLGSSVKTENLKQEIVSYIRRLVDKMNSSNEIIYSNIIKLLTDDSTYGQYIKSVEFVGISDTWTQTIYKDEDDNSSDTIGLPPEWLNLDARSIDLSKEQCLITFND